MDARFGKPRLAPGSPALGSPRTPAREQRRVSVVALGFSHVGKTALCVRLVSGRFQEAYEPTFESTYTTTLRRGTRRETEVLVKDTQGDDGESAFSPSYGFGYHGYVLVFSIASRRSLETLVSVNDKLVNLKGSVAVPRVIAGNKADLVGRRQVSRAEGEALAARWGCAYVECSAKSGENVEAVFNTLLKEIDRAGRGDSATTTAVSSPARWARRAGSGVAGLLLCRCCCRAEPAGIQSPGRPAPKPLAAAAVAAASSALVSLACAALGAAVAVGDRGGSGGGGGGGGSGRERPGGHGGGGDALTAYALLGFGLATLLLAVAGVIGAVQRSRDLLVAFAAGSCVAVAAEAATFALAGPSSGVIGRHPTLAASLLAGGLVVQAAAAVAVRLSLPPAGPSPPSLGEPLYAPVDGSGGGGGGGDGVNVGAGVGAGDFGAGGSSLLDTPGTAGLNHWRRTRV